jgi:hypothetical protein
MKHISHFLPHIDRVDMRETEEKFLKYPNPTKQHQIESLVEGVSIDFGHAGEHGGSLIKETPEEYEERMKNPY